MRIHFKILLLVVLLGWPLTGRGQSTAISFRGQLGDGGKPATGGYDFIFRLYNAATDGAEVAPAVVVPGLGVTNGYFSTALDYRLAAYQGGAGRWVQVEVRSAGTADAYAALLPRTALTPVPFALYALTAGQVSVTNLPTNLVYATQLQATSAVLAASVAAVPRQLLAASNVFTGSNLFSGAVVATNGSNQFVGGFSGNGAGLTNVPSGVLAGLLSSGQLPVDVVYAAQLVASNVALRAAVTADLGASSNGLSARLTATNGALVQLIANEGQLRTNALAVQLAQLLTTSNHLTVQLQATNAVLAASVAAVPGQLLAASNVFTGSNLFSGAVVATNGSNQLVGGFSGNGAGLTNLSATAVAGLLSSGQLPADVVYAAQLVASNVALRTAVTADLVASSNGLSARLTATNGALVQLIANEGLVRTNALAAQLAQLLNTSNSLTGQLQATNAVLAASVAAVPGQLLAASNIFTGSNRFSGPVVATNGSNQLVGGFSGNGGGLTNLPVTALVGLLSNGQLPVDVVYAAQLVASNVALRAAVTADLAASSNELSAQLTATNGALVQLLANEGQLRTNALAAQLAQLLSTSNSLTGQLQATNATLAASVAAVPGQLLAASNVFTGSNLFSGAVVATNGSNQLVGGFSGNGGGLTNLPVTALVGLLSSGQLPVDVVYAAQLIASNVALRVAVAADLAASSNGLSAQLTATNGVLVQLLANEGQLRTNALAAQLVQLLNTSNSLAGQLQAANAALAASVAAVPGQLLAASNVFTGSNRFSGPVVATNGSNQLVGAFSGDGSGLTNLPVTALTGVVATSLLPTNLVYTPQLLATNQAVLDFFNASLLSVSNDFASRLVATNIALVGSAVLGSNVAGATGIIITEIQNQLLTSNNIFRGTNYFVRPIASGDEFVVPLKIVNYINTNSYAVQAIVDNTLGATNLLEIQTGVISNTVSVDAAGRLSLGRGGLPAKALVQMSGDALGRVSPESSMFMLFEPKSRDPDRKAGWAQHHYVGDNPQDPRGNKLWTWGFNTQLGAGFSTNEPSLSLNMETWWEPWPGASDENHQMELYWQYSSFDQKFHNRPWALLLRGSNYLLNDLHVDMFNVGAADGSEDQSLSVRPYRAPAHGTAMDLKGTFTVRPGRTTGGGIQLEDEAFLIIGNGAGQRATLNWQDTQFALHGLNTPAPGTAFSFQGFTSLTVVPRATVNVPFTISGVDYLGNTVVTNLLEFRNPGGPVIAAVGSNGVFNATGYQVGGVSGITTNVPVLNPGGTTNVLVFLNGILVEVR